MTDLQGIRVFILEDESLIAMLIEDMLDELGCAVAGTAASLDEAERKIAGLDFDVAVLDINLNGVKSFPVAERLAGAGMPFIFSTGYGPSGVPPALQNIPVITKPFAAIELEKALAAVLAASDACAKVN